MAQVVEQLQQMGEDRFLAIYESLAENGFGPLDGEVAKLMKFRPQAIRKLPMAQRAKRARAFLERASNAELAYELFGTYLMRHHKELITGFLDATGVQHDEGMLEDVDASRPDAAKLEAAVTELDASHDPDDVTLYLSMCAQQWPDAAELDGLWRARLAGSAAG